MIVTERHLHVPPTYTPFTRGVTAQWVNKANVAWVQPFTRVCQQQYLFPPVALNLMWRAVIPSSLQRWATSWAANMAAYGEDSSLSAFTFIPPVTRQIVSLGTNAPVRQHAAITTDSNVVVGTFTYLPDRSVTWTKVSLKEAKMWHTPNTFSPSATWGPRLITCSSFFSFPLRGAIVWRWRADRCQRVTLQYFWQDGVTNPRIIYKGTWIRYKQAPNP